MNPSPLVLVTALVCLSAPQQPDGPDYQAAKPKLVKEPAYRGMPRYALFVFGPKAESRVWAVLDASEAARRHHDVLYLDRNGNGDLTEAGERLTGRLEEGSVLFDVGDLKPPGLEAEHREFMLNAEERADGTTEMWFLLDWKGRTPLMGGTKGNKLAFTTCGDSPKTAPVLHPDLDAPLTFQLDTTQSGPLEAGKTADIYVRLGTRGSGDDTFTSVNQDFLDLRKETVTLLLVAKDKEGREVTASGQAKEGC